MVVAAVQWVPSKELLDRSPRTGGLTWEQATYGSWSPELLPTLIVREAYGTRARDTDWLDGFYPYHEMNAYHRADWPRARGGRRGGLSGSLGLVLARTGDARRPDDARALYVRIRLHAEHPGSR